MRYYTDERVHIPSQTKLIFRYMLRIEKFLDNTKRVNYIMK